MIWVKKRLKAVPLIPSLCRWLWNRSSLVRCSDCAGVQPPGCVLKDCSSCVVVSPRPVEILITRSVFFITLVLVICSPTWHTPGRKWQLTRQMQVPGCAVKSHISIWLYFPSVRGTSILSSLKLQIIEHYTILYTVTPDYLPPRPAQVDPQLAAAGGSVLTSSMADWQQRNQTFWNIISATRSKSKSSTKVSSLSWIIQGIQTSHLPNSNSCSIKEANKKLNMMRNEWQCSNTGLHYPVLIECSWNEKWNWKYRELKNLVLLFLVSWKVCKNPLEVAIVVDVLNIYWLSLRHKQQQQWNFLATFFGKLNKAKINIEMICLLAWCSLHC